MESKQTQKVIAIDGPSASGKGTIASRVAAALGFDYLDSGALYRLTALYAEKQGVEWGDEAGVAALAQALPAVFESGKTFLAGEDVSEAIRTEAIGMGASTVAQVRAERRAKQLGLPCEGVAFERILADIEARDEVDSRRAVAPLVQLPDAELLDTSAMGIEETVKKVLDWYRKK